MVTSGARVGFVYGGCSFLALLWVFFFLPELKGRSLEELDEMFASRVPTRKFKNYVCTGIGADITRLQDRNAGGDVHIESKKLDQEPIEDVEKRGD